MRRLYNVISESVKRELRGMPYYDSLNDVNISTTNASSYSNSEVPCLDLWFDDDVLAYDENNESTYNVQMNEIAQYFKDTWGIRLTDNNFDYNMVFGIKL